MFFFSPTKQASEHSSDDESDAKEQIKGIIDRKQYRKKDKSTLFLTKNLKFLLDFRVFISKYTLICG
jgi:hypothetical protein